MTGRIGIRSNKWAAVCSCQSGAVGADAVSIYTFTSTCSLFNSLGISLSLCPPALLYLWNRVFVSVSLASICIHKIIKKKINLTYSLFFSISCRPAPVFPSERKRKWCHATTTALRGTTGDHGSGETSVRLASTMEEPIIAVPLLLSMATTDRGSFPSQSSPLSSPPQLQLPWQHRAAT